MAKIILASQSPRRQALLAGLGLDFEILPAPEEIEPQVGDDPVRHAVQSASSKARSVAETIDNGLVIGADTIVVKGGMILGKPANQEKAAEMLGMLSGCTHTVITGLCVLDAQSGRSLTAAECTEVRFLELSSETIQRYVATGEPMDKAGAYGIQGMGALLVEGIQGCYYNVVGLPLVRLSLLLKDFGINIL